MSEGKKMTRQEHIDHAVVGLDSHVMLPLKRYQYEGLYGHLIGKPVNPYDCYGDYIGATFKTMPTWEELVVSQKPWLESEETMAEWFKPIVLTDEDRARIQAERDRHPTMTSAYVPLGDLARLMVPAFKYRDGRTSRALMSNDEWMALPEEKRERASISTEHLDAPALHPLKGEKE